MMGGGALHFEKCSLLHLTKMKVSTIMAAIDPRTIPTMAPAERPPSSSSSSGLVGLVGILPLPGAIVPAERTIKYVNYLMHISEKSVFE